MHGGLFISICSYLVAQKCDPSKYMMRFAHGYELGSGGHSQRAFCSWRPAGWSCRWEWSTETVVPGLVQGVDGSSQDKGLENLQSFQGSRCQDAFKNSINRYK